jgi:hypothetical protein
LPDVVLGPLAGRPAVDWHRAPAGKWCAAQIVEHLTLLLEDSAQTFEKRRAREPMRRRTRSATQWVGYFLVLRLGWIPRGWRHRRRCSRPKHEISRWWSCRSGTPWERFRIVERDLLPASSTDLFAKHAVLGDLDNP